MWLGISLTRKKGITTVFVFCSTKNAAVITHYCSYSSLVAFFSFPSVNFRTPQFELFDSSGRDLKRQHAFWNYCVPHMHIKKILCQVIICYRGKGECCSFLCQ